MTIDEALDYINDINATVTWADEQVQDEDFFCCVKEWLEELKELRKLKETYAKGMETSYAEFRYKQGRADAIEYVLNWLEERYTACTNDGDYYSISEIREQLKEKNNE